MCLPGCTQETCGDGPPKVSRYVFSKSLLLSHVIARHWRLYSLPSAFLPSLISAPLTLLLIFISFGDVVGNGVVFAQADVATATVKGTITDQTGAGLSEATITLRNNERGLTRSVQTDEEGVYRVPLLQPGTYELRVEAEGFQPLVLTQVVLTIGQIDVRDFTLDVSEVNEAVTIKATPALVETERSQQSATIEHEQIAALPNLSRNFTSYIFTLAGITDVAAVRVQQTRVAPTPNSGFSAGGGNGRGNYVSIDGGENDSGVGSLRIRNLSVEAVREFQVNTNAYSAEYGFSAGTAINVITRSGANAFHGSGYLFYRSEKTAARDPLNISGKKTPEQRVMPGFFFEGPLAKNRAFFFTSFEALKYDITRLRSYTSNSALLLPTAAQSAYLDTLTTGPNATDVTRHIASQLQAALATTSYPTTMELLQKSEGRFNAPSRTYNWTTRLDFNPSSKDFVNGRFTWAHENNNLLPIDNVTAPTDALLELLKDYTVVGSWGRVFSPSLLNQLRIQFASDSYSQVSAAPRSTLVRIAGLIDYGRVLTIPSITRQQRYQFDDVLSWSRGRQEYKFGVSYRPVNLHLITELGFGGIFTFAAGQPLSRALSSSDQAVLVGPLAPPADTILTSLQAFNLAIPANWQQGFGNPGFQAWQHNLGGFGEVSWRISSQLTLNLGGRLNFDGEPAPLDRNVSFSPRVGVAWDPFGKGKTVVRAGFGTFYAPVNLQALNAATLQTDDGKYVNLQSRTLADGAQSSAALWAYGVSIGRLPFVALSESDVRAFGIVAGPGQPNRRLAEAAADYNNPYTVQASLGISQDLGRGVVAEVSGQMFHGVHLPVAIEGNYKENGQLVPVPGLPGSDLFGPQLARIDPNVSQKIVHSSEGNSIYYGVVISVRKRFNDRVQFLASYAYGKAIDDVLDFSGASTSYLATRRYLDRGRSAYDLRHGFVLSGTYQTPFNDSSDHFLARTLAGVALSPIITIRSGFPFNLYIGRDVNGDLNTTDRPFHAPRNSGIGENYYNADLRVTKRFPLSSISEQAGLELIVEATNLFNHANFLRVNDVVCGTTSQPGFINGCDPKFLTGPFNFKGIRGLPPTAPLGFVSAAPARQFQFGLKLEL
jgi:Carboxypeptidase regulatory-like domain